MTNAQEQSAKPASPVVQACAEAARRWTFDVALPRWGTTGRQPIGLFAERIDHDGRADSSYFRTFVQARHVFAFAEGGNLGWAGPWDELISETIALLLTAARRGDGLFVHKLNADGRHLDARADLYDQAFVLLALGKAGKALNRPALFDEAEQFLSLLRNLWQLPDNGFFEGEIVDTSIRRQNPHMHLFEAFLCLYEASGRSVFLDAAVQIAELCANQFIDRETGALLEYFDQRLQPASGDLGSIVEPGHCFEWAWLFERLAQFGWSHASRLADGLVVFARQHGICKERGVVINEVALNGSIVDANARLWPQTERLKAAISRYRRQGGESEAKEIQLAANGLALYLNVPIPGLWRDKLRPDRTWVNELAPGSSLYHIVCAYGELLRA
jgi:mannose-6-phosphate isomerase